MGNQDHEDDFRTKDEGWRGMGGLEENSFVGDEAPVEEDETPKMAKTNAETGVEDNGLGR